MQSNLHSNTNIMTSSGVFHPLDPLDQVLKKLRTVIQWQIQAVDLIQIFYHVSSEHAQPTRVEREMRNVNQTLYVEQVSVKHIRLLLRQRRKWQIHKQGEVTKLIIRNNYKW